MNSHPVACTTTYLHSEAGLEWPQVASRRTNMAKFVIQGGVPLSGQIDVEANKNAVLPMMAAALLTDDDVFLDNVPGIVDVDTMSTILSELGAEVERLNCHTLRLNCSGVTGFNPPARLV